MNKYVSRNLFNLLAKLIPKYEIDFQDAESFTDSERELFDIAIRDIEFYDPALYTAIQSRQNAQRDVREGAVGKPGRAKVRN